MVFVAFIWRIVYPATFTFKFNWPESLPSKVTWCYWGVLVRVGTVQFASKLKINWFVKMVHIHTLTVWKALLSFPSNIMKAIVFWAENRVARGQKDRPHSTSPMVHTPHFLSTRSNSTDQFPCFNRCTKTHPFVKGSVMHSSTAKFSSSNRRESSCTVTLVSIQSVYAVLAVISVYRGTVWASVCRFLGSHGPLNWGKLKETVVVGYQVVGYITFLRPL